MDADMDNVISPAPVQRNRYLADLLGGPARLPRSIGQGIIAGTEGIAEGMLLREMINREKETGQEAAPGTSPFDRWRTARRMILGGGRF
jgi:hypothetical protein